ncbi:hypothetical protein [Comamonas serinivorans]|nr:hypothetical protein [Comamonas serinivorans]
MNRCQFLRCAALSALALAAALPAQAQQGRRFFNDRVERGTLEIVSPPVVKLNGKTTRLSPGSRLFNEDNRIVMATQFVGRKLKVNYLTDNMGQVGDIWILTAAEQAMVTPGEQNRMKAASQGAAVKYNGPVFQPGKPLSEQHQFKNEY